MAGGVVVLNGEFCIKWINQDFSGTVNTIDYYRLLNLRVETVIAKDLFWGVSYEYGKAGAKGDIMFIGVPHNFTVDLTMQGGETYLRKIWTLKSGRFNIEGTLGAGYYISEYTEKENSYYVKGGSSSIGARTLLSLNWKFSDRAGMFIESGYRYLKFDKYKDGGAVITFVSPGNPKVESDFTGFTVQSGIFFSF